MTQRLHVSFTRVSSCFFTESLAVGQRRAEECRTERVRSILNTSHPGRRAALSLPPLALSLSHSPHLSYRSLSCSHFSASVSLLSPSLSRTHRHAHARARARSCIRLHFAVVNYGIDLNGERGSVSRVRLPFLFFLPFSTERLGERLEREREVSTNSYSPCLCLLPVRNTRGCE